MNENYLFFTISTVCYKDNHRIENLVGQPNYDTMASVFNAHEREKESCGIFICSFKKFNADC